MSLKFPFAAALAAFALAGVAHAGEVVTAQLAAPLANPQKVVAASVVWNCEGAQCVGVMRERPNVRACRQLAREVGALAAFGAEGQKLDEQDIASCNVRARQLETASR